MKTIAIITIVLFLIVVFFFGFLFIKKVTSREEVLQETVEEAPAAQEEQEPEELPEPGPEEQGPEDLEEEIDKDKVSEVEIYLDGTREYGIPLGNADYGLYSEEITSIYGEDFSNSGFRLIWDNEEYDIEPGSIHQLYVYTNIPDKGWDYTREEIQIEGDPVVSESIKISLEGMEPNQVVEGEISLRGWAADLAATESTNISSIEIYMDGPIGFGKLLGQAEYGSQREDVANAYNNPNYINSGFNLNYNTDELEPGSVHTIYVYAIANDGQKQYLRTNIIAAGDSEESTSIIFLKTNLAEEYASDRIEFNGWAVTKDEILNEMSAGKDAEYSVKKIVFVSTQTGNEDIFSMNLDGSEITQLTDHPSNDMYPAVSPDGKKIAYTSDIGGSWELVVMNWDGTDKVQITDNPERNGYPTWSFDGKYIYFEMHQDDNWELYRINSDGSNMKRLTFNPREDDWHPRAHPFEYKVLYESGVVGNETIKIMDNDGENIQLLTGNITMRSRVPVFTYDAKSIVFSAVETNNFDLFIMDSDGNNLEKLTDTSGNDLHAAVSPDNRYIAFDTDIGSNNLEIILMNIDGTNSQQITHIDGRDWGPSFMYQKVE